MIHAENGQLTIHGTNKEIFTELGVILCKLSETTSEEIGELISPDELARHCTVLFLEERKSIPNTTEAANEQLS